MAVQHLHYGVISVEAALSLLCMLCSKMPFKTKQKHSGHRAKHAKVGKYQNEVCHNSCSVTIQSSML